MPRHTILVVVAACSAAAAQPAIALDLPSPLTLGAAITTARERNPEIRAAEARYLAMRERPGQKGTLPDPMFGARYRNENSETSFVEVGAEQEIPFPGKLGLRARIAEHEADRERAMRDMSVLMSLASVAAAYTDLDVTQTSEEILHENLRLLTLMIEQAASRYSVGEAAQQDVLRATLERGALEERLTMLTRARKASAAELAALLDLDGGVALPPTAPLPAPPRLAPLDASYAKLTSASPALRAAAEDVLRARDAVRLARRQFYPDFGLMGSYMIREDQVPEWELGIRVKVPLYFWWKQRAGLAEAAFAERSAGHAQRNTQLTLEARLADLHAMAESALRLVQLYDATLIPQARLTLESARASYGVGRVDFLTMLSAFSALLEYRLRRVEEAGSFWRALAAIGPLVGETPLGEPLQGSP